MGNTKSINHIILSAILTLSVFCAVVYASCTKDACKGVYCLNAGSCAGGSCNCKSGIGGPNCETVYRTVYANTYKGNATFTSSAIDTSFIEHSELNNTLVFNAGTDTSNFNSMQLVWNRPGSPSYSFPITLSNNTRSGSDFTLTATTIPVDSFTYTGSGSINGVTATLNLTEFHPHSPPTVITFSNFTK